MANIKISELNELYLAQKDYEDYVPIVDSSADETKKISVKNLIPSNVRLIAVTDTEPTEYETGDKYYNTSTNKVYTASSLGWGNPEDPIYDILYVSTVDQKTYVYDGETLISVGGGAGGGDSTPIGTIEAYAGNTAPEGYLLCDGSAVSRTTYKDLYNAIGTTYGTGDGSATFNLPNIKGRTIVMKDANDTDFDTLGETGGSKYLQAHRHKLYGSPNEGSIVGEGYIASAVGNNAFNSAANTTIEGTGNSGNLQPYIVLNYIIKASKSTPIQAEVVNTYSASTTNTYSCDFINDVLLYDNSSGTTGNVTLSENASNFRYIEVFAQKSGCYGFIRIFNPNGKQFGIAIHNAYDTTSIQQIFARYSISGTTMTKEHEVYMNDNGSPTASNDVTVMRVIGYK